DQRSGDRQTESRPPAARVPGRVATPETVEHARTHVRREPFTRVLDRDEDVTVFGCDRDEHLPGVRGVPKCVYEQVSYDTFNFLRRAARLNGSIRRRSESYTGRRCGRN